jgi:DNA-directed RNA polymerase specialized sigma24 family protein
LIRREEALTLTRTPTDWAVLTRVVGAYVRDLDVPTWRDRDDVIQDALLRCWRATRRGQWVSAQYARMAARSCVIDMSRAGAAKETQLSAWAEDRQLAVEDSPPAEGIDLGRFGFTPRQEEVVQRRMAGMSHTEIAGDLGITEEASKRLLMRARGKVLPHISR